ncbi:hypothetical protein Ga0100231_001840 [Opitutaceae bacterium TAV4]|nr:hypothetical protein Ga0100231_001840 [Opitutaceae bacterium TAV4]RRK01716.1 hypothetical protein Ga0100230_000030 [Opitutaceae bacterium TAV3]
MKTHHHITRFLPLPGIICAGLLSTILALVTMTPAQAATVPFTDEFTSGSLNSNGWYFYNGNAGGAAWGTASAPADATLLSGTVLRNNLGTQQNTIALKPFDAFAFDAVGDTISVSISFRANGTSGTLYNLGFYHSTNAITANSLGGTNLTANSGGFTIYKPLSANSTAQYRDGVGSAARFTSTTTSSIGNAADHSITFTLKMTGTGIQISSTIDGVSQGSWTDESITATSGFSVNTLRLAVNGSVSYFDNVTVTATNVPNIPETSALGLWLGAFAIAATAAAKSLKR